MGEHDHTRLPARRAAHAGARPEPPPLTLALSLLSRNPDLTLARTLACTLARTLARTPSPHPNPPLPTLLRVQARCAIFTLVLKLCVASTCAAIAALVLAFDPSYKVRVRVRVRVLTLTLTLTLT